MSPVGLQLSLLEPAPLKPAEIRTRREQWFDKLRPVIREHYRGQCITTDEVHAILDVRPDLALPDGLSPNAMGHVFYGWEHAEGLDSFKRSERPIAKGNLLRVWRVR